MTERVEPAGIEARLAELDYPVTRADAAAECADVEVVGAGEPVSLGQVISEVGGDSFDGPAALAAEVRETLDRMAEE